MRKPKTKIFLADDHHIFREGLHTLLASERDFEVVGEASSGAELLQSSGLKEVNVLLLDIDMEGLGGVQVMKELLHKAPDLKVLVFSMHDDEVNIRKMLRNGARGYILKSSGKQELVRAIRTISEGASYLGRVVSDKLFGTLTSSEDNFLPNKIPLTNREIEVLKLVARGHTNQQIGNTLNISPRTVDTHRGRIMDKLDLHNAAALTHYAAKKGLLD